MAQKDEQEQRERIAKWIRDGKSAETMRKRRNHALIHMGLAAMRMIKNGDLEMMDLIHQIDDEKKQDLVKKVIEDSD